MWKLLVQFSKKNCPCQTIAHWAKIRPIRDRCFGLKSIFAEKIGEKLAFFYSKQRQIMQKF
jgi:hypothetical protein